MKYKLFFIVFFVITVLVAQEEDKIIDTVQDSTKVDEENLFIADYNNRLNIKLEASNELKEYFFPLNQNTIRLVPNLGIRYALVFNYRFLSVSLGIRSKPPKEEKENKGDTDLFELSLKFLFDNWSHRFVFTRVEGFYIANSDDLDPILSKGDRYVQFPDLTTHSFSGTSAYKFNSNYSVKATQSQTEIQLKSAGSFIPSIDYWIYKFDGADKIIDGEGNEIDRLFYKEYFGFYTVLDIAYAYTFVVKKWYFNVSGAPGVGIDIYKENSFDPDGSNDQILTDLVLSVKGGAGIGYNTDKYYFGINYLNRFTYESRYQDDLDFKTLKNSFFVFFGYRFKAPKPLVVPMDYIEKKVPILAE